jgi:hypothetical protein
VVPGCCEKEKPVKKMTRKLVLARETVCKLEAGALARAEGGTITQPSWACPTTNGPNECEARCLEPVF